MNLFKYAVHKSLQYVNNICYALEITYDWTHETLFILPNIFFYNFKGNFIYLWQ